MDTTVTVTDIMLAFIGFGLLWVAFRIDENIGAIRKRIEQGKE